MIPHNSVKFGWNPFNHTEVMAETLVELNFDLELWPLSFQLRKHLFNAAHLVIKPYNLLRLIKIPQITKLWIRWSEIELMTLTCDLDLWAEGQTKVPLNIYISMKMDRQMDEWTDRQCENNMPPPWGWCGQLKNQLLIKLSLFDDDHSLAVPNYLLCKWLNSWKGLGKQQLN